jgi:two-component system, cell cycle sensor histidine kinase and response regulator CckA
MKSELEALQLEVEELRSFKAKYHQSQKVQQESEGLYLKLFHVSPNPMSIATVKDYRIIDVNEAYIRLSGFSREELVNHTGNELSLLKNPEQQDVLIQMLQKEGSVTSHELDVRTKTGDSLTILFSAVPVNVNGEPCVLSTAIDITERRRMEEVLRTSEERFKRLVLHSNDVIAVLDEKGIVTSINGPIERVCGFKPEELIGTEAINLIHPDERKSIMKIDHDTLSSPGNALIIECRHRHKNGSWVPMEMVRSILRHDPVIKGIVLNMRDISERKKLNDQLQQAIKMEAVGILAGGVAHDFNNLLSVINGYSELLLNTLGAEDPSRNDLEQIQNAGQRAESLTAQLLAFSRKQILQPKIMNLNDSITEMSSMLQRLIGDHIKLVANAQPGLGLINADRGRIQEIIINLVVNARDAMPLGGFLTIETANVNLDENYLRGYPGAQAGPYVMMAISDNGVGMDDATRAHLFEPFYTTKRKGKGTGLGLSTVYGIVTQSNGFIWVHSEPGKGTTFKIYFPQVTGKSVESEGSKTDKQQHRGTETILLVEDEVSVRNLSGRVLREHGYTVLTASNGYEALDVVSACTGKIQLVVTDVVMPGMSGKALVDQLTERLPGLKALYISGYTANAIVHHGILDSGVDFLQKPFTVKGMTKKVREVLDR